MTEAKGAIRLAATLGAALTTACLAFAAAANSLQRLEPQPAADELQQGLSVVYHFNFFRHVREIDEWKKYREGKPGPVIPQLNYNVGQGNVLTIDWGQSSPVIYKVRPDGVLDGTWANGRAAETLYPQK